MGMAEQMKNLSEEILSSYKQRAAEFQLRLKENAELVKEVQKTLDGFRNDHMEMAATLRANAANLRSNLAQEQKDRLKSFQQLMNGIHGSISEIENEVEGIRVSTADMLKGFSNSQNEMATQLHTDLDQDKTDRRNWNSERLHEFEKMMKNINHEIDVIQKKVVGVFGYTNKLLTKFSKDHSKMSAKVKADLTANLTERVQYTQNLLNQFDKMLVEMSKENKNMALKLKLDLQKSQTELSQSDAQRLKEFNLAFTSIKKRVHEIQKYVNTFLGEFSTDRKQAAETWKKLSAAIAKLGKLPEPPVAITKPAPVPEKPEKKAESVKPVIPAESEPVKNIEPVTEQPKMAEPPKEHTLEEKVLQFINSHKNGVRVAEMEQPFGETRMRLGFITKKLLDEGKIQKIENSYYPKPKL